jgi:hypothetical protein
MRWTPLTLIATILLLAGCASPFRRNFDTSELDRCIRLIESRQIRRGMTADELKALFPQPDFLGFSGEDEAFAFLSSPRRVSDLPIQLPPQWSIIFEFKDGRLSDYSISMRGDK